MVRKSQILKFIKAVKQIRKSKKIYGPQSQIIKFGKFLKGSQIYKKNYVGKFADLRFEELILRTAHICSIRKF
jgi:hypothetical protein